MAGRSEASCCDHQKPFQGWARSHRAPQVATTSGKAIQKRWTSWKRWKGSCISKIQAISIYVSSGRLDIQFCVKRLGEMMTKPRKLGNLRLARLARYLVGTEKLVLRFDHQESGGTARIAADSDLAGSEERYSTHAVLEFHGAHLVDKWVASDQSASIEFRRSRALRNRGWLGTRNLHKAHVRGDGTNHQHRRRN